jgi:iron uptake system component EfeO
MRSSRSLPLAALGLLSLVAVPALAACGGSASGSGSGVSVNVKVAAKDDACEVEKTNLNAGSYTFKVKNEGSKTTEVYVYGQQDGKYTKVVGEVENIGPGTSRDLKAELAGGTYELACKPGQKGDGIRQKVTVSGAKASAGAAGESKYDREVELKVDASSITGLDGQTAKKGEKVEFKLENASEGTRTLEIVDPAGKSVAKVPVEKGKTGETIVELAETGGWTVKIEGGPADMETTVAVS